MAFKAALVVMAPDGDPARHRESITTGSLELITVVVELGNVDQAVDACRKLVQDEQAQSLVLCPGFSHEAVARVARAVGESVPVCVARSDVPGTMITSTILANEGWFPGAH